MFTKMTTRMAFCTVLMVVLSALLASNVQGQDQRFGFGYLQVSQFGDKAQIGVFDPTNPNQKNAMRDVVIPDGWTVISNYPITASPDGNWLAIVFYAPKFYGAMVGITNVHTGQTRDLIEGVLAGGGKNALWSPDSQHLAINMAVPDQEDADLYIYNLSDATLYPLVSDNYYQRDMSWSDDSSSIATFTHPCTAGVACADRLELYSLQKQNLVQAVDLGKLPLSGESACYPTISKDLDRVAFTSNCGIGIGSSVEFPNQVYIWTLSASSLEQVTNSAPPLNGKLFFWYLSICMA